MTTMYTQGYRPTTATPQQARPTAQKRVSRGGQPPKKKKQGKKRLSPRAALLLVLLAVALVAGGYFAVNNLMARVAVRPYADKFADNVTVDGVDLTGLTKEQGYALVYAEAEKSLSSWYVRLRSAAGEYKDITAQTLGLKSDPTAALAQAWEIGHDTGSGERKTVYQLADELRAAKENPQSFSSVRPNENADTSVIDGILETLERVAYRAPQDAALVGFNPDQDDPFTIRQESNGQMLDTAQIKDEIYRMVETFEPGEILLSPTPVAPSVTAAQLRETVALRYRATTPIDRKSTDARNENIRVAFSKFNGLVMHDGDKFSFNGQVGKRTQKNGFLEAFEYSYGELTTGWGGGVCQASTTVYLAAIQAGLKIIDRTAHTTPVSYTDLGKDATVSDPRIDFVFRNNTGGDIYLCAHVLTDPNNKKRFICEVRIYGPSLGNVRYDLETEVVENLAKPTEPEYVQDTNAKYVTYTDEEKTVISASEGYKTRTYLNTIEGNVRTAHTLVSEDTYPNRRERIYVGVTPRY